MILIIDNYDSFTYNLAQAFGELGQELKVFRNDVISVDKAEALAPDGIVISPGPGRPENAGITCELIKSLAGKVPILGVCLGHQAICHAFGAKVTPALKPMHGKRSDIFHHGKGLYRGLRNPFSAARYHSLAVPEATIAAPLKVSAYTMEGEVMGVSAPELMLEGVQFHPESIATSSGVELMRNFLDIMTGHSQKKRSAA